MSEGAEVFIKFVKEPKMTTQAWDELFRFRIYGLGFRVWLGRTLLFVVSVFLQSFNCFYKALYGCTGLT